MAWDALPSAVIGAVIALSGTLLADVRRDRRVRRRDRDLDRRRYGLQFITALSETLGSLRGVTSQPMETGARHAAAAEAMAPLYVAREQVLVAGSAALVLAAEGAFHRLVDVRDVVRSGAALDSADYHDAYHAFHDALWQFRLAVRSDLDEPALAPADLGRPDWSDRDRCTVCRARAAAAPPDIGGQVNHSVEQGLNRSSSDSG